MSHASIFLNNIFFLKSSETHADFFFKSDVKNFFNIFSYDFWNKILNLKKKKNVYCFFRLKMFWNICNFLYHFWGRGGGVCISLVSKHPVPLCMALLNSCSKKFQCVITSMLSACRKLWEDKCTGRWIDVKQ